MIQNQKLQNLKFPRPDVPKPDQSNVNSAPELNGIADRSIKVGETFDPIVGVTATDKEDGDLTSKIAISGTVDTTAPGSYKVNYSVTDSKNKTITKQRIITVTGS